MKRTVAGFAAGAFAIVAVATAPQAAATSDEDFLKALASGGVSFPARANQQVISGGHSVYRAWSEGTSYADTVADIAANIGGSQSLAGVFVRAATTSFCPKYVSNLP